MLNDGTLTIDAISDNIYSSLWFGSIVKSFFNFSVYNLKISLLSTVSIFYSFKVDAIDSLRFTGAFCIY